MEFKGQYLEYQDYKGLGGTLDLTPFNILEFEARRIIDIRTQNRLKDIDDIPQEVKMCEYTLINSIENYSKSTMSISENGNITSVNTDGYSESYLTPMQIKEIINSKDTEIKEIIRNYLGGVIVNGQHILFLGVDNASK